MSPADDGFPPAFPSITAIVALRHVILHVLWTCGVARRHLDDVYQDCLLAAWQAIEAGRFRPDPKINQSLVLRYYLCGIAWRQASHHVDRAVNRREIPVADPWAGSVEPSADPDAARDVLDSLQAIAALAQHHRDILAAFAIGEMVRDFAREHAMSEGKAWSRLRLAREELGKYLAGKGWRRR